MGRGSTIGRGVTMRAMNFGLSSFSSWGGCLLRQIFLGIETYEAT
jgi:hypothetical protein